MTTTKRNETAAAVYFGKSSPSDITPEQIQALIQEAHRLRSRYIGGAIVRFFRTLASVFRRPGRMTRVPHHGMHAHMH